MATATATKPTAFTSSTENPYNEKQTEGLEGISTTEPLLQQAIQDTNQMVQEVAERWRKREREQGTVLWKCPFCNQKEKTKALATKHAKKAHPAQYELAKMQNPQSVIPEEYLVSPKRTRADFLPAHLAHMLEQVTPTGENVVVRDEPMHSRTDPGIVVSTLPLSMAIQRLSRLTDDQLQTAFTHATNRGRTDLARTIRKEASRRGIQLQG